MNLSIHLKHCQFGWKCNMKMTAAFMGKKAPKSLMISGQVHENCQPWLFLNYSLLKEPGLIASAEESS